RTTAQEIGHARIGDRHEPVHLTRRMLRASSRRAEHGRWRQLALAIALRGRRLSLIDAEADDGALAIPSSVDEHIERLEVVRAGRTTRRRTSRRRSTVGCALAFRHVKAI